MSSENIVAKTITIQAQASRVWQVLTSPELIRLWLSDGEIQVRTDWVVGCPLIQYGPWHGQEYVGKGTVLAFDVDRLLRYSNWSAISGLPDKPEKYTIIEFRL